MAIRARNALVALIIQSLLAPTALLWYLPALAQDAGEGGGICEAPKDQMGEEESLDDDEEGDFRDGDGDQDTHESSVDDGS